MTEDRKELGFPRPNRAVTAVLAVAALLLVGALVISVVRSSGSPVHHAAPPPSTPAADEGLSDAHDGYQLELLSDPAVRGPAVPLEFRILDGRGAPQTDFDLGHTKLMHFYVLRDDMSHYQHLHPELSGDVWRTTISVPDGGQYRLYAEFLAKYRKDPLHPTVLGVPFVVPGDTAFAPLPAPEGSVNAGGFTVSRPEGAAPIPVSKVNEVRFRITDAGGKPVERLGTYLGAYAHMSAFNAINMGLLHQHPVGAVADGVPGGPELAFSAQFARRGEHRLFLEFSVDGQVHRAEFTIFVT